MASRQRQLNSPRNTSRLRRLKTSTTSGRLDSSQNKFERAGNRFLRSRSRRTSTIQLRATTTQIARSTSRHWFPKSSRPRLLYQTHQRSRYRASIRTHRAHSPTRTIDQKEHRRTKATITFHTRTSSASWEDKVRTHFMQVG